MFHRGRVALFLILSFITCSLAAQENSSAAALGAPALQAIPGQTSGSGMLRLSRREAVDRALDFNPALLASRERVGEARANVVTAAAFADPSLLIDRTGQTRPFDPRSGQGRDVGVGATIPLPGRRSLRRAVAAADLSAASFSDDQLRQQVATQTAQAYDALLVAMRHREDLQEAQKLSTDFLEKTRARFLGGTVPRLDVLKAELEVDRAGNDLIANSGALATARAALNYLLGRSGAAPIETTDTLEVDASVAEIEGLEQLAEASRPELKGLAAQIEGARASSQLARRFWLPDLSVNLTRNVADGSPATFTSAVGFGFPLFFWQHKAGEVAAASHREAELEATISDLRAQVSSQVQTAYASASTALRQALFIRDRLLPEAREVYRIASVSYGLGGSSALELLDAKRTLLDAQEQYADALGAANDARFALELAVGSPLPATKKGNQP